MVDIEQHANLPRLLDLDGTPSVAQRRRYWRYVHRWRRRLFYFWRQDVPDESCGLEVARGVDDLLAIALLLDYFRRSGRADIPHISEIHASLSCPAVAAIATAAAATAADPFVSAVLDPQAFSDNLVVPRRVFEDDWQRRLRKATSLLYRDKRIPLSLFGDFHQVCTGNPLNTELLDAEGRWKRRERGMFYTPAPIVDYLVSSTLGPLLSSRCPEDVLQLRLLDPSCGCGAFLIACFRYVSAWLEQHPDCDHDLACRLSLELTERVLHGCDIDPGAVSWTIRLEEAAARSVVRGYQLRGYQPPRLQHVYPFPYDTKGRPLGEGNLQAQFPLVHAYLLRNQVDLSKRALARGCPWYSTFRRRSRCASPGPRLLSARVTSGRSFSLIDDSQLLAHSSVVVLTGRSGMLDPYYLLGIVNSKVFTRYVSLTMPKTNVGRYFLRLSRLRWFPVPDPTSGTVQEASQAISSLVRNLVQQSRRHPASQELLTTLDRRVADLYGVAP